MPNKNLQRSLAREGAKRGVTPSEYGRIIGTFVHSYPRSIVSHDKEMLLCLGS
jgi:hypothetical protein